MSLPMESQADETAIAYQAKRRAEVATLAPTRLSRGTAVLLAVLRLYVLFLVAVVVVEAFGGHS
jgi:hypothetical protein